MLLSLGLGNDFLLFPVSLQTGHLPVKLTLLVLLFWCDGGCFLKIASDFPLCC